MESRRSNSKCRHDLHLLVVTTTKLPVFTLVPGAGIEPARLAARDFESRASTNSTTRATLQIKN